MSTLTSGLNPSLYVIYEGAYFYTEKGGLTTPAGSVPAGKFAVAANWGIPGTGLRVLMSPDFLDTEVEAVAEMYRISANSHLAAEVARLGRVARQDMRV